MTRIILALCFLTGTPSSGEAIELEGEIVDRATGKLLPARLHVRDESGRWFFARSLDPGGSAVVYKKENWNRADAVEMHTTLSAHPFVLDLPPGTYTFTIERGKEYFPLTRAVVVQGKPARQRFELRRWIDLAARGWYSGDTHVHRSLEELPNVLLAEDLNVAFPLTYWVTKAFTAPAQGDKSRRAAIEPKLVEVDKTHVFYPLNTEYEIFTVGEKRHTLGAIFVLHHKSVFEVGVPPLGPMAKLARREGALFELDKHNWPWSMALVPLLDVDLYELSNNHIWRTEFAFPRFGEQPPAWMEIEKNDNGMTEEGWIDFGLKNFYALILAGYRLRPTAGTASGVHPVPLGFGRVYVRLEDGFDFERWVAGLNAGHSFVTTGPMPMVELNGRPPGHRFDAPGRYSLEGTVESAAPLERLEVIRDGRVASRLEPENTLLPTGAYSSRVDATVETDTSTWIALRAFSRLANGRVRFAHTAPTYIDVPGKPLRPPVEAIDYLVDRVKRELERSRSLLPPAAIAEYERALEAYESRR